MIKSNSMGNEDKLVVIDSILPARVPRAKARTFQEESGMSSLWNPV